ncbi:GNAT family N-acetyltransferase [Exiguobacterium undae]|uniref:GCN5 family acetyltransferase n=1 Tax=Exiguobacterium undae TaxID=169177 RepID=A0ABX2VAL7_9BACL|nr:GNAT family N-acetyltransferase [Exiguobacterium undae]OAN15279.1 GCN5 family acetyltransferase [Exiguobacterium undae]
MIKTLSIQPINAGNRQAVLALEVAPTQRDFIESNQQSLQEARQDLVHNWSCLALCEADRPIGFMMIGAANEQERYIWLDRFMVDRRFQGKGYGKLFLKQAIQYITKQYDVDEIVLSVHPKNRSACLFYEKNGFQNTQQIDEANGEVIFVYPLAGANYPCFPDQKTFS